MDQVKKTSDGISPVQSDSDNEEITKAPTKTKRLRLRGHHKPSKRLLLWVIGALVLLAVAGSIVVLSTRYQNSQKEVKRLSNPQEAAKLETEILVSRVSKIVELPKGEQPTVATVQDVSKLQNQAFFKNAQNGDKVLIFTEAKRAILFRPSTNKVIEIAPVNIGDNQTKPVQ